MASSKMFYGGVPQDPDVRKLRESYPESRLEQGQIIPYSEVESILQERQNTNRYRSVTNKWRKQVEEETGVMIGVERGEGFKVLQENEKLDLSSSKLRTAKRASRRAYEVGSLVEPSRLTEDEKKKLDFNTNKAAKIMALAQVRSNKKLLPGKESD